MANDLHAHKPHGASCVTMAFLDSGHVLAVLFFFFFSRRFHAATANCGGCVLTLRLELPFMTPKQQGLPRGHQLCSKGVCIPVSEFSLGGAHD